MAKIEDLIAQIPDERLRNALGAEVKAMKKTKKFGLVFEEHLPETLRLPRLLVRAGELVALKRDSRNLGAENVGAVIYGDLMFKVFLYLDWEAFAALIREEGGEFGWSSKKDARRARALKRELQPVMVGGRIPQVRVGQTTASITDPNMVQLFFDRLTPRVMAKTILESVRILTEQKGAHGRSEKKR